MLKIFVPIFFGLLTSGLSMFMFLTLTPAVNSDSKQTVEIIGKNYPESTTDVAAFEMYWEKQIEKVGAKNTYDTFKEHYSDLDIGKKHEVAHYFGGVLYDSVGLEGISVCDDDFSYGCFHELITFSILDHGTGILTELNEFCTNSEFDCQHGIGHGILADFGYTQSDLNEALEMCNTLGSVDESDGCFGGIFMEYNLRTIWGKDAPLRAFDNANEDTTCEEVPAHGRKACYFWSAQWYMALSQNSGRPKQIEWTQVQCAQFDTQFARLQCINGLGYEIGGYETNPLKAVALCDSGGNELPELHHQQCVMSTLAGLNGSPLNREAVRNTCYEQSVISADTCVAVLDSQDKKRIGLVIN
jgi:hypothetical protein